MAAFAFPLGLPIGMRGMSFSLPQPHICPLKPHRSPCSLHHGPLPQMSAEAPVAPPVPVPPPVPVVRREFSTYTWRGHRINYLCEGPDGGPNALLIHGFGASVMHFRGNVPALAGAGLRVHAIDLLGFGASDKPDLGRGAYSLELWAELVVDFVNEMDREGDWRLVGNSIGSVVALMAAKELGEKRVAGLCLLNCAGGLTSTRGNVKNICEQAYAGGRGSVSEELVSILCQPADDEGAAEVFLAVLNGPPGPSPEELLPQLTWCPIYVMWGEDDPFTPFDGGAHPGSKFPDYHPTLKLDNLGFVGHCPHDAIPGVVNAKMIPFLTDPANFCSSADEEI